VLIQEEECIECRYLGICHGGCPVRAYTVHGDLNRKDPYCSVYQVLFEEMEKLAAAHARACNLTGHVPGS
jgi:sulfatase maturation enzyme AslB (radical SAM superfamily)